MKQSLIITYLLFILIMYVHLISLLHQKNMWRKTTKALLMPSLLFLYIIQIEQPSLLIILALICSFLGDVGLQLAKRESKQIELFSIALFGCTHLLYIIYFFGSLSPYKASWIHAVPYLCALFLIIYLYIQKRIQSAIQLVYAAVISCMAASSCLYMFHHNSIFSILVFTGASLFIFSDFLISRQMNEGHQKDEIAVMATYILAQFLIIVGIIG